MKCKDCGAENNIFWQGGNEFYCTRCKENKAAAAFDITDSSFEKLLTEYREALYYEGEFGRRSPDSVKAELACVFYQAGQNPLGPLPDWEIERLCRQDPPLIAPYNPEAVQAYGYDVSLSGEVARLNANAGILDPCKIIPDDWWSRYSFDDGETFVVKPGELWLALTVETFHLPDDVISLMLNKSRFARCGATPNAGLAPGEAGWIGRYVLELVVTATSVRFTVGSRVAQVRFDRGAPCRVPYGEGHRYQNQYEIRDGGERNVD